MKLFIYVRKYLAVVIFTTGSLQVAAQQNGDFYDFKTFRDSNFTFIGKVEYSVNKPPVESGFTNKMTDFTNLNFLQEQDGMVIVFRFEKVQAAGNFKLFTFSYLDKPVLEAQLMDSTIEIRRYLKPDNQQQYYDYRLYDKLFGLNEIPGNANYPTSEYELAIYITGSFTWIEVKNPKVGNGPDIYAHSPIHWGLNAGPRSGDPAYGFSTLMSKFLAKNEDCKITTYNPYTSLGETGTIPYIKIAGFKMDDLKQDLRSFSTNSFQDNPNPVGRENGFAAAALVENAENDIILHNAKAPVTQLRPVKITYPDQFSLSPNPVSGGSLTISSRVQKTTLLRVVITDSRGIKVHELCYQVNAGMSSRQANLPAGLRKGIYFVKFTTSQSDEVKKILVD